MRTFAKKLADKRATNKLADDERGVDTSLWKSLWKSLWNGLWVGLWLCLWVSLW
jgi:hypothetical protein